MNELVVVVEGLVGAWLGLGVGGDSSSESTCFVAPSTGESGGGVPSFSWIVDLDEANKESIPSLLFVVGFEESNADPRPPNPKPPVLAGEFVAGAGLSFFASGTGSVGFVNGLEGVEDLAPKALCPNPLDDPKALPDLTAPPDPKGLLPLSAGLVWPNAEPPKLTGFDDPKPANPPVDGTDPKALAVELAPKAVGLEGWPNAVGVDACPKAGLLSELGAVGFWPKAVCPNAGAGVVVGVVEAGWPKAEVDLAGVEGVPKAEAPNAGEGAEAEGGEDPNPVWPNAGVAPPNAGFPNADPEAGAPNADVVADPEPNADLVSVFCPNGDEEGVVEPNADFVSVFWPKPPWPKAGVEDCPNGDESAAVDCPNGDEALGAVGWPKGEVVAGGAGWPKADWPNPAFPAGLPNAGWPNPPVGGLEEPKAEGDGEEVEPNADPPKAGLAGSSFAGAGAILLPVEAGASWGVTIFGYPPASGYRTSKEMINPSWLYANNRGAGGKSGTSTPPTIPILIGFVLVKSSSKPIQDESSDTPVFPVGMTPLAVSSRIKDSQLGASFPWAGFPRMTATSDDFPDSRKVRCRVASPHVFRLATERYEADREGRPMVLSGSKNSVYVTSSFVRCMMNTDNGSSSSPFAFL
jgi:hypothetical protein